MGGLSSNLWLLVGNLTVMGWGAVSVQVTTVIQIRLLICCAEISLLIN